MKRETQEAWLELMALHSLSAYCGNTERRQRSHVRTHAMNVHIKWSKAAQEQETTMFGEITSTIQRCVNTFIKALYRYDCSGRSHYIYAFQGANHNLKEKQVIWVDKPITFNLEKGIFGGNSALWEGLVEVVHIYWVLSPK